MAGTLRSWRRNEAGAWPSPGWPGLLSWEKGAEPHVPESFEVELPEYERGRFSDAGKYSGGFVAILIRVGTKRRLISHARLNPDGDVDGVGTTVEVALWKRSR